MPPTDRVDADRHEMHAKPSLLVVTDDQAGQRIDNFLLARLKGVPKSVIYRCLRKGEVRVNKGRVRPEYRVTSGDQVRVPPIRVAESAAPAVITDRLRHTLEGAVLFEDDALIVLNKPAGMAVHGGSGLHWGVIEAFRAMRPESTRLELVHRIDRDTSGCLMIAKKPARLKLLHQQLQAGEVHKTYWAVVDGRWRKGLTSIDAPLLKYNESSGERFVRVSEAGKPSRTEYSVLRALGDYTLIAARPLTGRTHQIRVHCQCAGHPIVGDEKYQDRERLKAARLVGIDRMFLHARSLVIPDGRGGQQTFEAEMDLSMSGFLQRMGFPT